MAVVCSQLVVPLKVVDCITAFAIRSCLWKLLFDVHYTLFDTVLFVFFTYVVHASYLSFFASLLSLLALLSAPNLEAAPSSNRQQQMNLYLFEKAPSGLQAATASPFYLLSFLAILGSVPNNFDYILHKPVTSFLFFSNNPEMKPLPNTRVAPVALFPWHPKFCSASSHLTHSHTIRCMLA